MRCSKLFLFLMFLIVFSSIAIAGEINPELLKAINKNQDKDVNVIINFKEKPQPADISIIKSDGANIKHKYKIINSISAKVPAKAVEKISQRAFVKEVEPDYKVELVLDQSAEQINADLVWENNVSGENVDVAVLDTGINEFSNLDVEKGIDFTGEGLNDNYGHGTHVAGIISSNDENYKGIAYGSDLYNVKVLNKDGWGYASDVIRGIEWSVENGAEIISMSFGAQLENCDGSDVISEAVDAAVNNGVVALVSAGNLGPDSGTITSPGCSKEAITVGAVDGSDNIASFSSRGPTADGRVKPDLVAPGVGITSFWKDGSFRSLSGTSMSTPHVSGVAALLLSMDSFSPNEIKEILKSNALDLGYDENTQGAGRIDAYAAYNSIEKKAELSINFNLDKEEVNLNESFNAILDIKNTGNLKAENVEAVINVPSGLSTSDNLTKSINEIVAGGEIKFNWEIQALEEGSYEVGVNVNSSNTGSSFAFDDILVKNKAIEKNETFFWKNMSFFPPGLRKKEILPRGILKKLERYMPYRIRKLIQEADVAFSVNNTERARKRLEYAERNLERLIKEGDERYLNDYKENLNKASELSRDSENLSEFVFERTSKHLKVLDEVEEMVPERVREKIREAKRQSIKGSQEALEALSEKNPRVAVKKAIEMAEKRKNNEEAESFVELVKEISSKEENIEIKERERDREKEQKREKEREEKQEEEQKEEVSKAVKDFKEAVSRGKSEEKSSDKSGGSESSSSSSSKGSSSSSGSSGGSSGNSRSPKGRGRGLTGRAILDLLFGWI